MKLSEIQKSLKSPKGQFNAFGKYKYRSAEDILESVKPELKGEATITLTDELVHIGDRYYIKATATFKSNEEEVSVCGYAREEESKKGMDGSQITGASSSYARKYALNGLFAIDDTKDSDATNMHDKEEKQEQKPKDKTDPDILKQIESAKTVSDLEYIWNGLPVVEQSIYKGKMKDRRIFLE